VYQFKQKTDNNLIVKEKENAKFRGPRHNHYYRVLYYIVTNRPKGWVKITMHCFVIMAQKTQINL